MKFIKIGALSTSELQYIARQEEVDKWEEMSRQELIDCIEEIYEENISPDNFSRPKHLAGIPRVSPSLIQDFPRFETLPRQYPETVIYLIQKDPSWGYVFWSICHTDQEKLEERYGKFETEIKVLCYEDGCSHDIFNFMVDYNDLQWTVNFPEPGKEYQVKLFALTKTGEEKEIVSSEKLRISSNLLLQRESFTEKEKALILSSFVTKHRKTIDNKQVTEIINNINIQKGNTNEK